MNQYQKLSARVDVIQYTGENLENEIREIFKELIIRPGSILNNTILIDTPIGHMPCCIGDYIVRTRTGRFYPVKKEELETTYKKVT